MDNKKIFKYFNGTKDIYADPAEIDYQLVRHSESEDMATIMEWMSPEKNPVKHDDPEEETKANIRKHDLQVLGCHRLEPIIRASFGIPPFNPDTGEGMIQDEIIDLYSKFLTWRYEVKKNTEDSPTDVPPTEVSTSNDPSSSNMEENLITKDSTG